MRQAQHLFPRQNHLADSDGFSQMLRVLVIVVRTPEGENRKVNLLNKVRISRDITTISRL